jgi:type IV pilus assembly protein PilQ
VKKYCIILILIGLLDLSYETKLYAQNRIDSIHQRLVTLSEGGVSSLKSTVNVSVSDVGIQEVLRGIGIANKININVDPSLNIRVSNNFSNITVLELLIFLARQYQLSIDVFGNIISISKYIPTPIVVKPTPLFKRISYDKSKELVTVDLKNDTLESVARKIAELTKRNIVLGAGLGDVLLTSFVQNNDVESLWDKIAISNNLKVVRNEDNSFFIEKRENQNSVSLKNTSQGGMLSVKLDRDSFGSQSLISFDANNVPISDIVKEISKKLNISYFLYADIKGSITLSLKKMYYMDVIKLLFRGTDYTVSEEGGVYLIGDRRLEGLRTTKVINLKYRSIEIIIDNIPSDIKKDVELKGFPELNSIILSGSAPAINDIEQFIHQMDKLVPMVLIEVIVIDVNKSSTVSTGIKAGLNDSMTTNGTFLSGMDISLSSKTLNDVFSSLNGNGVVNLGKVSPNFYVSLKALEDRKNIRIRSTPKLSTLNGHAASLKIGQTQYYQIQTQNVIGAQTPQTVITQQYNQVNADLNIKIEPFVSGDNQVTLKVDVEFSNFTGTPTLNAPPSIATRQFKSMIRIKNEEMIILGGLEETEKSESGSGIPILSRIPILKWLFSSKTKTNRNSKLIVIVKPTLVN